MIQRRIVIAGRPNFRRPMGIPAIGAVIVIVTVSQKSLVHAVRRSRVDVRSRTLSENIPRTFDLVS